MTVLSLRAGLPAALTLLFSSCIVTTDMVPLLDPIGGKAFWARDFTKTDSPSYQVATIFRGSSKNAELYVEIEYAGRVTESVSKNILDTFERTFKKETPVFGKPMDVDNNGKVTLVVMDIKDSANQPGDPFIGGYFDPFNEFTDSSIFNLEDAGNKFRSNEKEILYLDSEQQGIASTSFFGTLAHEFQHVLHFSRDYENFTVSPEATSFEDTWVNEGLSEMASIIAGYGKSQQARLDHFDIEWSLTGWKNTLQDYSTTYMFFRWLTDNYGYGLLTDIINNPRAGIGPVGEAIISAEVELGLNNYSLAVNEYDTFILAYINWLLAVFDLGQDYFSYLLSFDNGYCSSAPCTGYGASPLLFTDPDHTPDIALDTTDYPAPSSAAIGLELEPFAARVFADQADGTDPSFDPTGCPAIDSSDEMCGMLYTSGNTNDPLVMFHSFSAAKRVSIVNGSLGISTDTASAAAATAAPSARFKPVLPAGEGVPFYGTGGGDDNRLWAGDGGPADQQGHCVSIPMDRSAYGELELP